MNRVSPLDRSHAYMFQFRPSVTPLIEFWTRSAEGLPESCPFWVYLDEEDVEDTMELSIYVLATVTDPNTYEIGKQDKPLKVYLCRDR